MPSTATSVDEAELDQRLVELGVPDALEGVEDLRDGRHATLNGSEPIAVSSVPLTCISGGTSMP